jgi:hypothetical protein
MENIFRIVMGRRVFRITWKEVVLKKDFFTFLRLIILYIKVSNKRKSRPMLI